MADPYLALDDLVALVQPGCKLAIPKDAAGAPMAAVRALLRRGAADLHLICLPVGGFAAELLIGGGCVGSIEASAVSLGEFGLAPRFRDAIENGRIRIKDATCQALYSAVQAAEKGAPFAALRGLIGSDVLGYRDDWTVIQNPLAEAEDPVVVVPALKPDVALFHARLGDHHGNVWVGNARDCVQLAHAAHTALVTVEQRYDGNLMDDERYVAGTIPPVYVGSVALAPGGAWPVGLAGVDRADADHMRAYVAAAKTDHGFADYLAGHVIGERVVA